MTNQQPLTRIPLESGEYVLIEGREAPGLQWVRYLLTLGAYEYWRRAKVATVTNRRFLFTGGRITHTERGLPLNKIQDVTVKTQIGFGRLIVTTAGGASGRIVTPWMSARTANAMRDALNARTAAPQLT